MGEVLRDLVAKLNGIPAFILLGSEKARRTGTSAEQADHAVEEAVSRTKVLGNRKIEARNRRRRVADPRDLRSPAARRDRGTANVSSDSSLFHRGR